MITTPTIYLASPIDQGQAGSEKAKAKQVMLEWGMAVFDPAAGWTVPKGGTPNSRLQTGNLAMMRQSHGVLAILKKDILTIGVVLEIEEALHVGIPTQVYSPDMEPSWSLAYLGIKPHDDLTTAIHTLRKEIDNV